MQDYRMFSVRDKGGAFPEKSWPKAPFRASLRTMDLAASPPADACSLPVLPRWIRGGGGADADREGGPGGGGVVAVVVIALVIDLLLVLLGRALMPWTRAAATPAAARRTITLRTAA